MDFRDCLESICSDLDGVIAATLMGVDGLPVESVESDHASIDVPSLLVEYSNLLAQVGQSAEVFAAGALQELSIQTENLTALIRPVTEDYFLALALLPAANTGKARYLLRIHGPQLVEELV